MKTFKIFTSWLAVIIFLGLTTACSNEKEEEDIANSPIIGTWIYKNADVEDTVTFYNDGSYKAVSKLQGITSKIQGTYIYENDIITLYLQGSTYTTKWRVVSVTSKTLILQNEDVEGSAPVTYQKA